MSIILHSTFGFEFDFEHFPIIISVNALSTLMHLNSGLVQKF